ncbi:MAG TPA: peptidylprolyl isomerase [Pirellulaceae bacterium]|nr:peptidylprolyl isomerase [Pirellulaceae bacterium]
MTISGQLQRGQEHVLTKSIMGRAMALLIALSVSVSVTPAQTPSPEAVLAVVNGKNITQGELDFLLLSRQIPQEQLAAVKERLLDALIERRLMREFLDSRKAKPSQIELDEQIARVLKLIRDGGDDPDKVLARMGMTQETLRQELSLPLTWSAYLRLVVTSERLKQYFEKHRAQFDGTQVRVRQIFLKLPNDADEKTVGEAQSKLQKLKEEIKSQKISFADAAALHSEAPSKSEGGDTGWITYRGKLPIAVSDAAFALKDNEVSEPIRSPFGLHLVTLTERKPGELSLEDVRAAVFNELSQELWRETVKAQREKARIEIRSSR